MSTSERLIFGAAITIMAVCLCLLAAAPVRAQSPADFKPSPYSHVYTAADGKEWAISPFDFGIIAGVGMMMRDPAHPVNGAAYWTQYGEAFRWWQCQTPCGGAPSSQVLSEQVAAVGGPAHFILELMHYANIFLLNYYGYNPSWPPQDTLLDLTISLDPWTMKAFIPTVILTRADR